MGPPGRPERDFLHGQIETGQRGVLKLKENRFRLDIRKQFFTVKVVRFWNRWTREVVEAPSMEMFKASLDRTLSNLV